MHTEGSSEPTIQLKWSLAPRPEPADSYQVRILKTPDYAQFETQNNWPDNRLFAQAKTQGWFYSLKLWIIFKILLKFKYLPWNKLHYWVLEQSGFCNWDFCHLHAKCVRAAVSCVCVCAAQAPERNEWNVGISASHGYLKFVQFLHIPTYIPALITCIWCIWREWRWRDVKARRLPGKMFETTFQLCKCETTGQGILQSS